MSGCLQVLMASRGRVLADATNVTLTSGDLNENPGLGGDRKHYGYHPSLGGGFGSRSPTSISGYTISDLREVLIFFSTDGSYSGEESRKVVFKLAGGAAPLAQNDLIDLTCPTGSQVLTGASAAFTPAADGGQWIWAVTTGTDDGSADYLGSGTVVVDG